jgi:hypothetical protein
MEAVREEMTSGRGTGRIRIGRKKKGTGRIRIGRKRRNGRAGSTVSAGGLMMATARGVRGGELRVIGICIVCIAPVPRGTRGASRRLAMATTIETPTARSGGVRAGAEAAIVQVRAIIIIIIIAMMRGWTADPHPPPNNAGSRYRRAPNSCQPSLTNVAPIRLDYLGCIRGLKEGGHS